jgi:NADH:ubiquinone oxidoreductase subunit 3 (subunit A)
MVLLKWQNQPYSLMTTFLMNKHCYVKETKIMFAVNNFILATQICLTISVIILIFTFWGYRIKLDTEKTSIYECGFTPYQSARNPLDIKFYLVSLLFIVFDIEVLFLFPYALNHNFLNSSQMSLLLIFIFFMFLGILYEMRLKAIDF